MDSNTRNNDRKLLTMVQQHQELYNKRNKDFKNNQKKKELWAEIGKELEMSAEHCARRFVGLREKFSRELKQEHDSADSGLEFTSRWPYFDDMQFLRPHMVQRRQRSTLNATASPEERPLDSTFADELKCDVAVVKNELISENSLSLSPPASTQSSLLDTGGTIKNELLMDSMQELQTTTHPQSSLPYATSPLKRKAREMETDSTILTGLCEVVESKDKVTAGFTTMLYNIISPLENRKKLRVIHKITELLYELDKEEQII